MFTYSASFSWFAAGAITWDSGELFLSDLPPVLNIPLRGAGTIGRTRSRLRGEVAGS